MNNLQLSSLKKIENKNSNSSEYDNELSKLNYSERQMTSDPIVSVTVTKCVSTNKSFNYANYVGKINAILCNVNINPR